MKTCKVWNYRHAVFGLASEVGEVCALLQKAEYKKEHFSEEELVEELGDVLWYWVFTCLVYGLDPEVVWDRNIEKLEARHGQP